jgi:hypothetical protein
MKNRKYTYLLWSIAFSMSLSACTKPGLKGRYSFVGDFRMTVDSTFVSDTATGVLSQIIIDSTYQQEIQVSATSANVTFTIRAGTFSERVMDRMFYTCPASGPFSYKPHGSGVSCNFIISGDSLFLSYSDSHTLAPGGFIM